MTESKQNSKEKNIDKDVLIKVKEIQAAANYCYNCNRCVTVCPVSHLGLFSPRSLVNDLTFLSIEEAVENNNIWECLTCGQCNIYCPMTQEDKDLGVKIPDLVLELRKLFKNEESQNNRLSMCETHDGVFPIISKIMGEPGITPNKLGFLEGSGLKTKKLGEIAVFVGCMPLLEDIIYNVGADYIDSIKTVIGLLNTIDISPVVLNEKCCGHDILWSKGDLETFKKLAEFNVNLYRNAGVKTIITACAEGYRTWKYDYPKYIPDFDFEVVHFSEFFLQNNIMENLRFPQENKIKITYHDACRLGRLGGKVYDAPREILKKIPGVELIEMQNIKDDANCCGVSAFSCCNEHTRILRKNRIEEAINTGADYLIVPCPKCLSHFNCYLTEPSLDQSLNKITVIDLATFIGKRLFLF
jgi:Fe-S oxidoreductase